MVSSFKCFVAISVALYSVSWSRADIVTQSFVGQVTVVNVGGQSGTALGVPVNGISIGSTFVASFVYDTATSGADSNASASQGLFTLAANPNNQISVDFGSGRIFQKNPANVMFVDTLNNVPSTLSASSDILSMAGLTLLPSGWSVANPLTVTTRLTFGDATGTAMPNDSLPTSFSPQFNSLLFSQSFTASVATPSGTFQELYIEGTMTAIPEPSSLTFLVLAVTGAALRRRR